jgi:excisionase family DNA binding protein
MMSTEELNSCLREGFRRRETETELGKAVARMRQPFRVGDGEKMLYEGFTSAFNALFDAFRAIDDSIPPDLPQHVLDPAWIARTFGFRVEDFRTVPAYVGAAETLKGGETKVDGGLASHVDGPTSADYISIAQAAQITGLSQSHIRRAVRSGELTASNVGTPQRSVWRIARKDLAAWMERKKGGIDLPPKSALKELIEHHLPGLRGSKDSATR